MENRETLPIATIIPSYNHEKYVGEAIESVLDQSKKSREILVVDDCSTDDSRTVLERYSKHVSIIHHEKNMGGAETLNTGIRNSSSEYVAILNSDDTWVNNKLELQFDYMQSHSLDVCFTQANIMNAKSEILENPPRFFSSFEMSEPRGGSYLHHFFYRGNFLCHPSLLVKKEMYSRTGLYNGGLEQLPDFAKWIDFTKQGKIGILPEKLINYRYLESENASSQRLLQNQIRTRNEVYLIFATILEDVPTEVIKNNFQNELDKLQGIYGEIAKLDPASALLLSHPEGSLANQAMLAGIVRLFKKANSENESERDFLRAVLNQIEIEMRHTGSLPPPTIEPLSTKLVKSGKRFLSKAINER